MAIDKVIPTRKLYIEIRLLRLINYGFKIIERVKMRISFFYKDASNNCIIILEPKLRPESITLLVPLKNKKRCCT